MTTATELEQRLRGIERSINEGKSEIKKFNSTIYELDKKVVKGINDIVVIKKDVKGLNKKVLEGVNQIVKFNRKLTTAEKAIKGAKKLASDAKKLGENAKKFIKKAGPLLKLVDVADSLFNLALQSALIILIADRFDAMDQLVDSHSTALSQNLGFLQRHEKRLDTLEPKVKNLNDIAAEARSNASKALVGLEALEPKIDNLNDIAAQANSNASKGLNKVEALEPKVKSLNDSAAQANSNASKALNKVEVLEPKVKSLNDSAAQANSNASKALTGISSIETKLKQLNDLTAQANSNASKALQKAPVPGPAGPAGKPGKDGAPGKDGKQGIAGVTGPTGIPGSAGATGATGPAGAPGAVGKTGATGAPGVAGAPGRQGVPGIAGAPGKQGVPGKDGAPGKQGVPGKDGAPGKQGAPGVAGAPGKDGAPGRDGIDGKDAEDVDLSGIEAKLEEISNLVIPIPGLITKLPAQESFKAGVAEGTCRTTQPGGCMAKRFDGLDGLGNSANTKLDGVNATLEAAQFSQLGVINRKLGPELPGGVSTVLDKAGKLVGKTWDLLQIDRVLNILNLLTSMHNAYMLSSSLFQTLFSAIANVLDVFGIEDKDGNALDVNSIVGKWTEDLFKRAFGVATVEGIKAEWKQLNRIYQAASNVIWSVQSIFDSTRSLMNIAIENTGKIGNALRRSGAVFENAYGNLVEKATARNRWQKNLDDFTQGVSLIESVISTVDSAASEVLSIQSTAKELVTQQKELNDSIDAFKKDLDDKETTTKEASKAPQL